MKNAPALSLFAAVLVIGGSFGFPFLVDADTPPTITVDAATAITQTAATIPVHVPDSGSSELSTVGVNYTTDAYYQANEGNYLNQSGGFESGTSFEGTRALTSLECGTTYHYQGLATNHEGFTYTDDYTFDTLPCDVPQPPVITIITPQADATVDYWHPTITWGDADECAYRFSPNAPWSLINCDGSGLMDPPLEDQTNILYVRATNDGGSTYSEEQVSFFYAPVPQISSCADFEGMNEALGESYVLTEDLDCSGEGNAISVGTADAPFTGTFNGYGHTITVDIHNNAGTNVALFGVTEGAHIHGLKVTGSVTASFNVGGLIGTARDGTSVEEVAVKDMVINGSYAGGIVGNLTGSVSIQNSYASIDLTGDRSGGIIGYIDGVATLDRSYATGRITGEFIGGLVGQSDVDNTGSLITNSFSVVRIVPTVEDTGAGLIGTLWGENEDDQLENNFWDMTRSTQSDCINYDGAGHYSGAEGICEGIDTSGEDAGYFKDSHTNGPLGIWDANVWDMREAGYPILKALTDDTGGEDYVVPEFEYEEGDGSSEDPYQIDSCEGLSAIRYDLTASYLVTDDIFDCSMDPIGDADHAFSGHLDGDSHVVGLSISGDEYVGLFGLINGGIVENLNMGGSFEGTGYVGALAGVLAGATVDEVHIYETSIEGAGDNVGGLAGLAYFTQISRTTFNGAIENTGGENTGGLIGFAGPIMLGYSSVNGTIQGSENVGGVIGSYQIDNDGEFIGVASVSAQGTIIGESAVGGLIGLALNGGSFADSYANATVSGQENVGGLVGAAISESNIINSYAAGTVIGRGYDFSAPNVNIGGIAGRVEGSEIFNSFSASQVKFLRGYEDGPIYSLFAGEDETNVGGVVGSAAYETLGEADTALADTYYDRDLSGMPLCFGAVDTNEGTSPVECHPINAEGSQPGYFQANNDNPPLNSWDFGETWRTTEGYPDLLMGEEGDEGEGEIGGPLETILDVDHFHGGGIAQEWHGDDSYWSYDLPFMFNFYGHDYTTVYVSSNGFIGFVDDEDAMTQYELTIENGVGVPMIAAMGADISTDVEDGGTEGDDIFVTDNGDGKVIFRWFATELDNPDNRVNFEIVLNSDNSFELNYGDASGTFDDSKDVAVGVNDGNGLYRASEYDSTSDFNELNTSAWNLAEEGEGGDDEGGGDEEVPAPAPVHHSSGSHTVRRTATTPWPTSYIPPVSTLATGSVVVPQTAHELQHFLNTHGYPVAVSGPGSLNNETDTFGALTVAALAKFQAANGIVPASGFYGPLTKAFIAKMLGGTVPSTPTPTTVRDLTIGSSGADVTSLQKLLIAQGYAIPAGATGYFAAQTKDALAAYQKAHGITPASGYFGITTRTQMKNAALSGLWW